MADRLAPRACLVCGPRREPCCRCAATDQHQHLALLDRRGRVTGQVALCRSCVPSLVVTGVAGGAPLTDALQPMSRAVEVAG